MKKILVFALLCAMICTCSCARNSNTVSNSTDTQKAEGSNAAQTEKYAEDDPRKEYDVSILKENSGKEILELENEIGNYAEQKTKHPIEYSFTGQYISAPYTDGKIAQTNTNILYSYMDFERYINEKSNVMDTTELKKKTEVYNEEFFNGKDALIVIAFGETEGSSNYTVSGGFENILQAEDFKLTELAITVKRTGEKAENKGGIIFVPVSREFTQYWDSFSLSLYD